MYKRQSTHCVISGHRGLPSSRLFTDIDQLSERDIFTLSLIHILYYSIDVSGDEALAELEEGETYPYNNTIDWTGVDQDSATANVTNSEVTLKKDNAVQNLETGETLVYYYVTVNPESRNLHPDSNELDLRDTLTPVSYTHLCFEKTPDFFFSMSWICCAFVALWVLCWTYRKILERGML